MKHIYLDYAAATPLDSRVLAAMQPYFSEQFYNPWATYLAARAVRQAVESAKHSVAQVLGARITEVHFVPGATEANNQALRGIMEMFPGKKLLVSSIEHKSVLDLAKRYHHAEMPVNSDGIVDLAALDALIDDDTVLLSVLYANNEVGTLQPIADIASIIARHRAERQRSGNTLPLLFHTDAAQAANYLDIHVSRLGVDLMTLNGGKFYGPKQTGVLYVRTGVPLELARSGTENVPGIVGFAKALEIAQAMRHAETRRLQALQKLFFDLIEENIAGAVIHGSRKKRLPNNVHLTIPGEDNERLLMALDEAGVMAAAGSACLASSEEPSHVLRAMGVSVADAQSSLRLTMGRDSTEAAVRQTVATLARLVA